MFYRSERLLLRPPWPEDWQAVRDGIGEEAIVRNLGRAPWPYTDDDAREFLSLPVMAKFPRFLVSRAVDNQLVGCIGIDPVGEKVELGYWIARRFWGRGYATEAARAVLEIARLCGHRHLVASHFVDNPASGRVLEKAGFVATGQTAPRYSAGRGEEADVAMFSLDLAAPSLSMTAQAA